jgi:hypothetical protein
VDGGESAGVTLAGVVALAQDDGRELGSGGEVHTGFAHGFELAVELDGSGAVAVAEQSALYLDPEPPHLRAFGRSWQHRVGPGVVLGALTENPGAGSGSSYRRRDYLWVRRARSVLVDSEPQIRDVLPLIRIARRARRGASFGVGVMCEAGLSSQVVEVMGMSRRGQFWLVHVGVAAALAAATVTAVGLVQSVAATGSGSASVYVPIVPCRLVDTRPAPDNVGAQSTPLRAAEVVTFAVWGTNATARSRPPRPGSRATQPPSTRPLTAMSRSTPLMLSRGRQRQT